MRNDHGHVALISPGFVIFFLLPILFLVSGCSTPTESQEFVYVPPTPAVAQATATSTPTAEASPAATARLACENNLIYVQDLSIPDGTLAEPGALLDKRWEVRNGGSCNWDEHYQLRLISGEALQAEPVQKLFPARSATNLILRINFVAPADSGVYRSAWQAYDPDGNPFGDPIFIEIAVAAEENP
jgi:hypothetical protein